MDASGPRRSNVSLLFSFMLQVLLWTKPCDGSLSPVDGEEAGPRQQSHVVQRQDALPSWHTASPGALDAAAHDYGLVPPQSHIRGQRQTPLSKLVYSFNIQENTIPGTVVAKVQAAHPETPRPITYSVQADDGDNLFLLNPHSGEFLLSRGLDFEAQRFYVLTVGVQQGGDAWLSGVRVYFNVLDVNDNPPVFERETYSASLLEDTPVGTCFLPLNVFDKDAGENSDFDLRIVTGDDESVFSVDPTGKLCLSTELDRERKASYNLTVTANDCPQDPSLQFTSTARVDVTVQDVNDNSPAFLSAQSVSISEDSVLHSVITTLHAEDVDSGSNGEVWYHLKDASSGWVTVHNTSGRVYLTRPLDREQTDTFTVSVTAVDKGSPPRASTMNLTVQVADVNDHDPEFPQGSYSLSVTEDTPRGTSIFRAQARDLDAGANGQLRYTLSRTNPFAVDAVRGVVIVTDDLDREIESNYTIRMTAEDRGNTPRSSTAVISITVLDVNDFTPVFFPDSQTIRVSENEDDLSRFTWLISASDEDLGINSQLTYLIQTGNEDNIFSLSPNGTLCLLNSLDREKESVYILRIIAVDAGWPPLTGTLTLHVLVDDENDNRPQFLDHGYSTVVSEDSPAGTVFAILTATDMDEGANGEIRYSLVGPASPFSIDTTSGELFTTDVLDRETVAFYRLTVISSDKHPTRPLSNSVLVNVLVGDVNDHSPHFQNSPYVAHVPSEMGPASVICAVRATDGDTELNAELQFSLYGPRTDQFIINPRSGTVFMSSSVTGTESLTIDVRVEDGGEVPKFDITTISVVFHNVSEFPAVNVDVVRYFIFEDESIGTLVARVSATSPRTGLVFFYLASGDPEEMFHVDEFSGELTVENPLDYENSKDFTLLIEARDSGSPPFSSFVELHVNISDVNDNFPQFTQGEYRCEISENSQPAWVCDVILAIDADSGSYGSVRYSIAAGESDTPFIVDPENGELSSTMSLDRESTAEYNLTVEATDQEHPLHRARASVIVVVLDRNDHAPRFSQIFMTEIPEDAPIGHPVIQVISTDEDDINADIAYSIIEQSYDIPFSIDNANGYIMVARELDRERQDHYVLKVNANDSAWSISTDVVINVKDVNDNKPVFLHPLSSVVLPETKAQEVFVVQVIATDADTGKNGQIWYAIEPPVEFLWINASSGEIYTTTTLHDFPFKVFNVTVFAYDCGIMSLSSNTTVTVRLVPYNYHPPTFLPFPSKMAAPFDLAIGTEVVRFSAVDEDSNHSSADIEYALKDGNAMNLFCIHADNGKVTLNGSLFEHLNETLTLSVIAKDGGFPPLSTQTEITFEITARNHFTPRFVEPDAVFSVTEDIPVGSVIGKIQAEDADYGANGIVAYSIRYDNKYLPFSLGKSSALLTLISNLDFENESMYHFQIVAADGGWLSKTGTANITVNVVDVNDNPPLFAALEYIASVPENSRIGTSVFIAKATDPDSTTNSQISYSLIAGHVDNFLVDSVNGTITTADVFDYEETQAFHITVKASNMAGHAMFSVAHVVIRILDVNEYIPTFETKEYNFSAFTHVPIGTRIGKVKAVDLDLGPEGEVFYLSFGQNKKMGFEIDGHSGEIYTSGSLRMRRNTNAGLKVLAKNRGVISGTDVDEASVWISITEINNAPAFSPTVYLTRVREDSAVGTSVITVRAVDEDSIWAWSLFTFSIENGNENSSFAVHPLSGVISVHSALDREQWPRYNLSITATDKGTPPATGTANVLMTVDDINDHAPALVFREAQVKERQPPGTVVARLKASDLDLPPNQGPFTFWFVKPTTGIAFSLTPGGVLVTTRSLDGERSSVHRVSVAVRDAGTPQLSSTTMFHIRILDENDNPLIQRNIHIEVKYYGSSFQGGMIGNVGPRDEDDEGESDTFNVGPQDEYDEDESDMFNCSIKSASFNMFHIPYGTCELWSAPFQGEATYNITVEAVDQFLFPVNNSVYINYKGFTSASIDNCIIFYVSPSSEQEFLTHKYLRFVKALDGLFNLQASKTHVFGVKATATEILLLAAVKSYNGQYLSREVASGISTGHRRLLETQTNVTITHITSDPCLTNPCQNGAACGKNIHISQDIAVLESPTFIFASPRMEIFSCTCPAGFTGTLCEADVDECQRHPCRNEGACVNNPGGFFCQCQSGFFGPFCNTDFDGCPTEKCQNGGSCMQTPDGFHCHCDAGYKGDICEQLVDHCESAPCVQGKCINSLVGFSCHCPFGVSGVRCEQQSYGFEELSFMEFPPLDPRSNLISLEVATVQPDSLLLYSPAGASGKDFLALELVDGRASLSYELGDGPVRLETAKRLTDGLFHSITVRRIGNIGSLLVDRCTDVDTDRFCFSQSDGFGSQRILNVGSGNMTFGGLRSIEGLLLHPGQIRTHDFVGCVRNINMNGLLLTPSLALAAHNILERCPRETTPPCQRSPCKNGGLCHDLWSHYVCECKSPYRGSDCNTEMPEDFVLHLVGNAYIEYVFKERFKRSVLLKGMENDGLSQESTTNKDTTQIEVKFKTQDDGVLVFVLGNKGYTVLTLQDRKLLCMSDDTLSALSVETPAADGLWHVLSLTSDGQKALVYLDGLSVLNATGGTDLTPVNLDRIVLGAAASQDPGFSGCVEYVKVAGYALPVSGHSEVVEVRPSLSLLQSGCPSPASCLPSPCPAGRPTSAHPPRPQRRGRVTCRPGSRIGACICLHNATGRSCDVCFSDGCPDPKRSAPLWVLAVLLPLFIVAVIIGLLFTLRHFKSTPSRTVQGRDHLSFRTDEVGTLRDDEPDEEWQPPDLVFSDNLSSGPQHPSGSQTVELESDTDYYEVDSYSIHSAFYSEADPGGLKHCHSPHCARHVPEERYDSQIHMASEKSPPGQDGRNVTKQSVIGFASPTERLNPAVHLEMRQYVDGHQVLHYHRQGYQRARGLEPTQGLSVEEVRQLNNALKPVEFCGSRNHQAHCHDTSADRQTGSSSEFVHDQAHKLHL